MQKLRNITFQLLEALTHLHSQGIVHKDLRVSECGLSGSGCGLSGSGCGLSGSGCGLRGSGCVSRVVSVVIKLVGVVTGMPSTSVVGGIPCLPPSLQLSLVFIDAAEVVKLTGYAILKR